MVKIQKKKAESTWTKHTEQYMRQQCCFTKSSEQNRHGVSDMEHSDNKSRITKELRANSFFLGLLQGS